jgi:hypothetical protein
MAYISAAIKKPIPSETQLTYFDLLQDLSYEVLMTATRRVILEHRWPTPPSVAELRQAAIETNQGKTHELSESEAWDIAWQIVRNTDPEVGGSFDLACRKAKASSLVIVAVKTMGLHALCYGEEPVGVVRGQFMKVYSQLAARERRLAILPPAVHSELAESRERRALPETTNSSALALAGHLEAPAD